MGYSHLVPPADIRFWLAVNGKMKECTIPSVELRTLLFRTPTVNFSRDLARVIVKHGMYEECK